MSDIWKPGPGWFNTNPLYGMILLVLFSLPIVLPTLWIFYTKYIRPGRRKKELSVAQTKKQKKKEERERRKEIKRSKRKTRGHNT